MAADPLRVVVAVVVAAVVAGAAVAEAEVLLQLLALLHTAMEDQMGASKGTPPLSLMETSQKVNNS